MAPTFCSAYSTCRRVRPPCTEGVDAHRHVLDQPRRALVEARGLQRRRRAQYSSAPSSTPGLLLRLQQGGAPSRRASAGGRAPSVRGGRMPRPKAPRSLSSRSPPAAAPTPRPAWAGWRARRRPRSRCSAPAAPPRCRRARCASAAGLRHHPGGVAPLRHVALGPLRHHLAPHRVRAAPAGLGREVSVTAVRWRSTDSSKAKVRVPCASRVPSSRRRVLLA